MAKNPSLENIFFKAVLHFERVCHIIRDNLHEMGSDLPCQARCWVREARHAAGSRRTVLPEILG